MPQGTKERSTQDIVACALSFVNETCPYKESSNFLGCAWLC